MNTKAVRDALKGSPALLAAWVFAIVSCGYLVARLWSHPLESTDFRYIWLAGDLWAKNLNPYGPDYAQAGAAVFPTGYPIAQWMYPFHWYIPARAAAIAPPEQAFRIWLFVTALALACAGRLTLTTARELGATLSPISILFGVAYVASSSVTGFALRTGQPAVLAACGFALCLFGIATKQRAWVVFGLILAMLKPHLGVPLAAAALFMPGGLVNVIVAALGTLIASVPAFLASGVNGQVSGLLRASGGNYQQTSYNTAEQMSGLPQVIERLTGWSMPISLSMLIAAAVTAGAVFLLRHRPARERALLFAGLTCAITAALVGLHSYDLIIGLLTLPLLGQLSPVARCLAIAGFALIWRVETLSRLLTGGEAIVPTVQTIAMFLILAAWVLRARDSARG